MKPWAVLHGNKASDREVLCMPKIRLGKPVQKTAASSIKIKLADDKPRNGVKELTIKPLYKNKRLEKK